ncbi:MAG: hypothetical protein Q9218_000289 [Villophora microphyllina]
MPRSLFPQYAGSSNIEFLSDLKNTSPAFFIRLSSLFDSHRTSTHGSVFLTQKRLSHDSSSPSSLPTKAPFADLDLSSPLPILIRASNGRSKRDRSSKIKISAIVQPDEIESFFTRYAEVMKVGTPMLKKRDRSGRKKVAKAKKKQKVDGSEKKP